VVTILCEYGGIGRRTGFRYQRAIVGVRVSLLVPYYAPVAQLVEQWFEEPRVSGSNPFGSTSLGR
jgi:hypothetical protein